MAENSSDFGAASVNLENRASDGEDPEVVETEEVTVVQVPVSGDEESNGFSDCESSNVVSQDSEVQEETEQNDGRVEIQPSDSLEQPGSTNEESRRLEVDHVSHDNGILVDVDGLTQDSAQGGNLSEGEDASKEDMFVDAPDQLSFVGGRNVDLEGSVAAEIQTNEEDKKDNYLPSPAIEDGVHIHRLMDELSLVRAQLEKTLAEKELMSHECKEYKEEREMFARELGSFYSQLQMLDNQHAIIDENGDSLVDFLCQKQQEGIEHKTEGIGAPLHVMVSDCSKFASHLKTTLDEHLQSKGTIRELHAVLFEKDQEVEELFTKVAELSVSRDVFASYMGSVQREFDLTRGELLEHKRKELDLIKKLDRLEGDNKMLLEELDKAKEGLNDAKSETSKTKMELAQAESKLVTSREKLSMAVTKGKALVQQRDSLRISLNEKSNELEKCLAEMQQKASALEAAEAQSEELVRGQNLVVSLQESILEKNKVLQEIEHVLSEVNIHEEIQSAEILDRVRWLVDQKHMSEGILLENRKIKDVLSSFDLPETILSSELELQIDWLGKSLVQAKSDLIELLDKVTNTQEAIASHESQISESRKEISYLTESLLAEKQEKDSLQTRAEDLMVKYEGLAEKKVRVSSDRDLLIRKLLEVSGSPIDEQTVGDSLADTEIIVENCIEKIRERSTILEDLTVKYEELAEKSSAISAEKDRLLRVLFEVSESQMDDHWPDGPCTDSNTLIEKCISKIRVKSKILEDLTGKYEQSVAQVSSEKHAILRKLLQISGSPTDDFSVDDSSADVDVLIEKCMGTIRERINASSESSTAEREQFQRLQSLLYTRDQELMLCEKILEEDQFDKLEMIRLSAELRRISEEIITVKSERDALQKDLVRAKEKLSLAVKKGKALMQERGGLKLSIEENNTEIEKLKHELQQQESTLTGCKCQIESLLIDLERIPKLESDVIDTKNQRYQIEQFLKESNNILQRLTDSIEGIVLPENLIFEDPAEKLNWMGEFIQKLQGDRTALEQETEKAKEEVYVLAGKLEDSHSTIRSLEDALSQAERSISLLADEKELLQVGKVIGNQEQEKANADAVFQAGRLADAFATIKSLEDALSKADNDFSVLSNRLKETESQCKQEILSLNAKLAACMEELAETHGRFENHSSEMVSQLNHLEMLMKHDDLFSLLKTGCNRNFEGLKNLGLVLQDIQDQFALKGSGWQQIHPGTENNPYMGNLLLIPLIEDNLNGSRETNAGDLSESITSSWSKIVERFKTQNKLLGDKFESFSTFMNERIAILSLALQATRDEIIHVLELMDSLKLDVKNLETVNQDQENSISILKNNIAILISACNSATQELLVAHNGMLDPSANPELDNVNSQLRESEGDALEEQLEYANAAEKLLMAARRIQNQLQQFENAKTLWLTTTEELQNELRETKLAAENAIKERNLNQDRISDLEGNFESLQKSCSEMRLKLEDYQGIEDKLHEKEKELSLQSQTLVAKDQEADERLLSESQVEILCNKVNTIGVFSGGSEVGNQREFPGPVDKILYIIDNFVELQHVLDSLNCEKEELQRNFAAKVHDIELLKREVEITDSTNQDLEKTKNDFTELVHGAERIIQQLAGNSAFEDKKSVGAKGLLQALEKLVADLILEADNSKSKTQELGTKLQGNQKLVDELLAKVKLLEDSLHERPAPPETVQERRIYEAPSLATTSEISEIEDVGQPGMNNATPPVPPAAHVRTLRKGSSDHLALNIDLESDRLINHPEADDDKGHIFKSLNTSGFVPKQGKLIADRIDGIWVSGGRMLMSQPRARIGLITYWLFLHIWVLGTIL